MMNEKQFIESQKECAKMLGMSLSEYQDYCKSIKVPTQDDRNHDTKDMKSDSNNTTKFLNFLGLDSSILKKRKDY